MPHPGQHQQYPYPPAPYPVWQGQPYGQQQAYGQYPQMWQFPGGYGAPGYPAYPAYDGHYGYAGLMDPEEGFANLQSSRDIIDSFEEFRGLPIHITEFNTSYIPNCPLHDTNRNAAYIAHQLSRLGDMNESYSYWTFGDIFEEQGVPFTPFHGGFGLVANGGIPKPTFWTFRFFKKLEGVCVHRSQEAVVIRRFDGSYRGTAWNSNLWGKGETRKLIFSLPWDGKEYCIVTRTVDEETCNPLRLWHNLGEPSSLTKEQQELLKEEARPFVESFRKESVHGEAEAEITVRENGVVYFEIFPVNKNAIFPRIALRRAQNGKVLRDADFCGIMILTTGATRAKGVHHDIVFRPLQLGRQDL